MIRCRNLWDGNRSRELTESRRRRNVPFPREWEAHAGRWGGRCFPELACGGGLAFWRTRLRADCFIGVRSLILTFFIVRCVGNRAKTYRQSIPPLFDTCRLTVLTFRARSARPLSMTSRHCHAICLRAERAVGGPRGGRSLVFRPALRRAGAEGWTRNSSHRSEQIGQGFRIHF
jgi:hypothetical protein